MSNNAFTEYVQLSDIKGFQHGAIIMDPPEIDDDIPTIAALYGLKGIEVEKLSNLNKKYWQLPPSHLVGLENLDIPYMKVKAYKQFRAIFSLETVDLVEKNVLAYKAFLLFGNIEKMLHYVRKNQDDIYSPNMPIVMRTLSFPDSQHWEKINFKVWGDFLYQHGFVQMQKVFGKTGHMVTPYKGGKTLSIRATNFNIIGQRFANIDKEKLKKIISLSHQFNLSANEFFNAADIFNNRTVKHDETAKFLPDLKINGTKFNLENAEFKLLSNEDVTKLFLGHYTDSCEKISDEDNSIGETIEHSYNSNKSGFYVVTIDNKIIAHSWAWIGKENELVFDGFETHPDSGFGTYETLKLLKIISDKIEQNININNVWIGQSVDHIHDHIKNIKTIELPYQGKNIEDIKPKEIIGYGGNKVGQPLFKI